MINFKYFNLFLYEKGSVNKDWKIEYEDGSFTDFDIFSESIELTESLCSERALYFGSCESSCLKFKISNIPKTLIGRQVKVSVVIDNRTDEPLIIGRYKIWSERITADRQHKDIIAYDAMYDILNADVAVWYNKILPNTDSSVTLKQFRESFVRHFGLAEVLPKGGLVNDNMIVKKTIDIIASEESETESGTVSVIGESISGKDIITAICEINGCFGHIGRDGKFHYIYIPQAIEGLYPANDLYPDHAPEWMAQAKTGHLYPQEPKSTKIDRENYIKCQYEDYRTKTISKVQIRQEENDIGKIWPETPMSNNDNCYIIEGNFLVYGKSSDELSVIAKNIYGKITDIIYRPFTAECVGNPCMEVGDPVSISTKYEIIESYILKRTLKGIQALRDNYSASGTERYLEKVNGVHRSIMQLKGKANILTRTIEETKIEMYDIEEGLNNTISITAEGLDAKITNTKEGLENSISVTAEGLDAKINKEVVRAGKAEEQLSNSIKITAEGLDAEIKRAKEKEGELVTSVNITAAGLETKVSEIDYNGKEIASKINQSASSIKIDAEHLELSGNTKITGGYMHIAAEESTENIIELKRQGTIVQMGTDGMKAQADTREAIFQYSNISVYNRGQEELVAQLLDTGKGISSYGWDSFSDERLKHDIEPMDVYERAQFIYAQKPVRFKYNYDKNGRYRHGLIAQNVLETIGDEDWAICGGTVGFDEKTYLALNYSELIADLIAATQYQKGQIENMQKEINELKERIVRHE